MGKIQDKKRRTYSKDWDFFVLWIISNPNFYEDDCLKISKIEPFEYEHIRSAFKILKNFFEKIGIKEVPIYKYSNVQLDKTVENEIKKDYPEDKSILASYRKIQKGNFTLDDILDTYGYIGDYSGTVYFSFDYTKEELDKMYSYLNKYIDEFVNHELIAYKTSILVFEKQKEWFIKMFKDMQAIEKFGNNFIVSKKEISDKEVLFFHTLYALEKLGYIEVVDIWHNSDEFRHKTYYANIIVNEIFIKEINQEFQKTNPKKYIEKFDSKTGVLTFSGKKIELSKNGKETDPVLLMKTLLKKEEGEWVHNDEIFEDWGIREDEQVSKNKIYFALQKINTTMGLVAQIDDFIEGGTKKARINPKYRKVDK